MHPMFFHTFSADASADVPGSEVAGLHLGPGVWLEFAIWTSLFHLVAKGQQLDACAGACDACPWQWSLQLVKRYEAMQRSLHGRKLCRTHKATRDGVSVPSATGRDPGSVVRHVVLLRPSVQPETDHLTAAFDAFAFFQSG